MTYHSMYEGKRPADRSRDSKATTTPSFHNDRSIDPYDRPRSPQPRSTRPHDRDRHGYGYGNDGGHSIYDDRAPSSSRQGERQVGDGRGQKHRHNGDDRRFKVHYESDDSSRQSRHARDRRQHDRSSHAYRDGRQRVDHDYHDRHDNKDTGSPRPSTSARRSPSPQSATSERSVNDRPNRSIAEQQAAVAHDSELPPPLEQADEVPVVPVDEDAIIEARRKRREELRNKHRTTETPLLHKALQGSSVLATEHAPGTIITEPSQAQPSASMDETSSPSSPTTPLTPQLDIPSSPAALAFDNDLDLINPAAKTTSAADTNGNNDIAAADYKPSMDKPGRTGIATAAEAGPDVGVRASAAPASQSSVKPRKSQKDDFDMFASDDDDDIEDEDDAVKQANNSLHARQVGEQDGTQPARVAEARQLDKSMLDDWDDPDGHYRVILDELLDNRYIVQEILGKGVSSTVARALDTKDNHVVAIKIIIKQDLMRKYGLTEMAWMRTLAEADPDDKRHILRLERNFEHKGHLCVVFESMSIDLREVLKRFGRDIGINIQAVRVYAHQMFLGLGLMAKCDIIHADLKPDNMLVNDKRNKLKIADFGSAIAVRDIQITTQLVSRFYRAPEIMIGQLGTTALDMWSIGCTLFELYTGKFCFTGDSDNQMLKQIMETKGKVPNRMLKQAEFWHEHFDTDGTFISKERDQLTNRAVVKKLNMSRTVPNREIRARVFASSTGLSADETKELNLFADLVDKCLTLDPVRRIRPHDALKHPFINRTAQVGKK